MEKEEKKPVLIPSTLYKKIEERVKVTEFGSVEEYVTFVLEEVLKEEKEEERVYTKEEEEEVKNRLRALGYLD